jgi:hypothetical protein
MTTRLRSMKNSSAKRSSCEEWVMTDDATRRDQPAMDPETRKAILAYFDALFAHRCPCGVPVEREVQGGDCVYAEPCGHVLYQGKVGAFDVPDK